MDTTAQPPSTFERLAAINVSAHTEKKNGLTYLSWAWAWDQLMRQDPTASYEYLEPKVYGNDTVMVYCAVTAFGVTRVAHLPVMDHRNKPIPNPDAFAMNTAMQRSLVKAIALHGLGLYIYAGEDLPLGEASEATDDAPTQSYDDWLADLVALADGGAGVSGLTAAVVASRPEYKNKLRADKATWKALEARAAVAA